MPFPREMCPYGLTGSRAHGHGRLTGSRASHGLTGSRGWQQTPPRPPTAARGAGAATAAAHHVGAAAPDADPSARVGDTGAHLPARRAAAAAAAAQPGGPDCLAAASAAV
eukprot:gene2120-biopygen4373